MHPSITEAVPVDVSDVAKWYFEEAEIETIDYKTTFPCVISPWPVAFYEFNLPSTWKAMDDEGKWGIKYFPNYQGVRCGVLVRQFKVDPTYEGVSAQEKADLAEIKAGALGQQLKFVQMLTFITGDKNDFAVTISPIIYVDDEGACMGGSVYSTVPDQKFAEDYMRLMVFPVYFAMGLMHCKNVHTVDVPSLPPKLAERRQKAGERVWLWKNIVIDTMKKSVKSGEHGQGNSINLALRIARGHFKDYREGRGLFGKLHGRYWWDDIKCASGALGAQRSYEVKGPG